MSNCLFPLYSLAGAGRRLLAPLAVCGTLMLPLGAVAEPDHVAPINVNTATAESLADAMDGVGPTRARAIVAFRDTHGPFASPDELVKVNGIGDTTLEKNRRRITVE